ncbi:UNVERIFIED_CONTAM: hypothetical protein GTU68_015836 [Idotea baltica]|nr:hypothetical protein [Idotea baltica]
MKFGFPSLTNIRSFNDFIVSYDNRARIPYWVFEHLTPELIVKNKDVERSKSEFHEDTSIHPYFR